MMDVPKYIAMLHQYCPTVPLLVESISNSPRPIPYFTEEFWKKFPEVKAADIVDFLKLVRKGRPLPFIEPAAGESQKDFDQRHQKQEFEHSIKTLRRYVS